MSDTEKWLPVSGWEGLYEVSDQGRVRTVERVIVCRNGMPKPVHAKIRVTTPHPSGGHHYVTLYRENRPVTKYAHHLVLEAFVGPRPSGMWALHRNDDQNDNRLVNLYYGTPKDNSDDADRNGSRVHGESAGPSVLKETQVESIRRLLVEGRHSQREIAGMFGVTQAAITDIATGKSWRRSAVVVSLPTTAKPAVESWLPLVRAEGYYEISDYGRVRRIGGPCLKPTPIRHGHYRFTAHLSVGKLNYSLHRAVFETFVRPLAKGEKCFHVNGNTADNYVSNLEATRAKAVYRRESKFTAPLRFVAEAEVGRRLSDV